MKKDVTFILFGATGDLTEKKLLPAIYNLNRREKLGKFVVIGCARRLVDKMSILEKAKKYISKIDDQKWKEMVDNFHYFQMDFDKSEDYQNMNKFIIEKEKNIGAEGDRIFYLATLPDHFEPITKNISKNRIEKCKGESKVMYEKPFGSDFKSAKKLNSFINEAFDEKHIYRVDHYLGKELVGNIVLLRFTNRILEPLWSNENIESVQIIFDENFGVEGRGSYYDKYGTIRDVVQNHVLQVLSLLAMERPTKLLGENIRERKAEILKRTKIEDVFLGQFEGYLNEEGVSKSSKTETFFAGKFLINNKRWKGVPFYVRAGKNLDKKESVIHIKFKEVDCLLSNNCPTDTNYLTIRIQPDEGFSFELNSKKVGETFNVENIEMDYCHKCENEGNTPESYEVLFEQAILGEKSLFVRNDEIEMSWKIVDAIKKNKYQIYQYKSGSKGGKEFADWNKKNNIMWKS